MYIRAVSFIIAVLLAMLASDVTLLAPESADANERTSAFVMLDTDAPPISIRLSISCDSDCTIRDVILLQAGDIYKHRSDSSFDVICIAEDSFINGELVEITLTMGKDSTAVTIDVTDAVGEGFSDNSLLGVHAEAKISIVRDVHDVREYREYEYSEKSTSSAKTVSHSSQKPEKKTTGTISKTKKNSKTSSAAKKESIVQSETEDEAVSAAAKTISLVNSEKNSDDKIFGIVVAALGIASMLFGVWYVCVQKYNSFEKKE